MDHKQDIPAVTYLQCKWNGYLMFQENQKLQKPTKVQLYYLNSNYVDISKIAFNCECDMSE